MEGNHRRTRLHRTRRSRRSRLRRHENWAPDRPRDGRRDGSLAGNDTRRCVQPASGRRRNRRRHRGQRGPREDVRGGYRRPPVGVSDRRQSGRSHGRRRQGAPPGCQHRYLPPELATGEQLTHWPVGNVVTGRGRRRSAALPGLERLRRGRSRPTAVLFRGRVCSSSFSPPRLSSRSATRPPVR